jgi:hypothetical protein
MPAPSPKVADKAPDAPVVTPYDRDHFVTYLRLLDADRACADWAEVARIVLGLDPVKNKRARAVWKSHLERAKWMTVQGYKDLIPR